MEGRGQLSALSGGNTAGLWRMVGGSLLAHVAAAGVFALIGQLTVRFTPPPQNVLMTKIVRLGTPRPKELLPRKEEPPPPPPPPPPAAVAPEAPAPPAPQAPVPKSAPAIAQPTHDNGPSAKDRINSMSKSMSALERLKQKVDGQADGSVDGDADEAQEGNAYATEVQKCIQAHYTFEGLSEQQIVGHKALVLVRIESDGRFIDNKILEGSGMAAFDETVRRAVMRCGRASPPPEHLRNSLRRDGLEVVFER